MTDEGINWGEGVRPATRDYTPLYDAERHELAYDFYIHDGGIASRWALEANIGDKLVIGRAARLAGGAGRLRLAAFMSVTSRACRRCAVACWDYVSCR